MREGNSLAKVNPQLAGAWHPSKNGLLTPFDVTPFSHKKVWWKCNKADDHEWETSVANRSKGSGCPICAGQKVVKSNCLATTNPELAKEWHPTKNGNLTPWNTISGSNKSVWWKCDEGTDHEYKVSIYKRSSGRGCTVCAGFTVVLSNCLATINPNLVKEWHTTKNGKLTPYDVTGGSGKKVWWKCNKADDHEWETTVALRNIGGSCPFCSGHKVTNSNCLETVNPLLALQWHPTKNSNLSPRDVATGSNKKVWWKCDSANDHEWEAVIASRSIGASCPFCQGKRVSQSNCLAVINPNLAKQWHPTKNGNLSPYNITIGSDKKIWWKCEEGEDHEYQAPMYKRSKGSGCPICDGKQIVLSNCLATLNPKLASEWHPAKNGRMTPFNVTIGITKKFWWKCHNGDDHEWEASIGKRNKGTGCPMCAGRIVVLSNCLATLNPPLASEWHPSKNGKLTPLDVTGASNKKIWWKCNKGDDHEWQQKVPYRSRGMGCPICAGRTVVLSNCLATLDPKLATEWHPTKNGKLTPFDVTVGTGKKVWWKCPKGDDHEWQINVATRAYGSGCPFCTLTPQSRQELIITHELITIFDDIDPKGFKTNVNGKLKSIDIYIPNLKLGIEFDGSYWHKDKSAFDKLKTEELKGEGINIVRVRQKPLKRIFASDVIAEKKYDGKAITNGVLLQILKDFKLNEKTINKIHEYVNKPDLQNEKGLEDYIDMILNEKAKRKKSNMKVT
mgnify:CR=1 FL=1